VQHVHNQQLGWTSISDSLIHKSAAATWLAREGMPTDDGEAQDKNEEAGNNEDD